MTTEDATDTGAVSVVLQSEPTGDVTVSLDIIGADQLEGAFDALGSVFATTVGPFTSTNWDTPQTVTIYGVDELIDDGNQNFTVVTSSSTSTDSNYSLTGTTIADALLTNQDDDQAGFVVTSSDNETSEAGDTAVVTITPTSAPTAPVTIPVGISDTTEGSINLTSVLIPAGGPTPVNVTITGLDDIELDIDVIYQLVFGDPTSTDPIYDAFVTGDIASQNIVNLDDDDTDNDGNPNSEEDAGNNG